MKMSEMEENGRNYVERNLDWSGAASAGRTTELDVDFKKDFLIEQRNSVLRPPCGTEIHSLDS